jgi:hypothetical protein
MAKGMCVNCLFESRSAAGNGCIYLSIRRALLAETVQTLSALGSLQLTGQELVPRAPEYFVRVRIL